MATQTTLACQITVEGGAIRVGANPDPPNKFTLTMTNQGDSVKYTPNNPLFLDVSLGLGKDALFFDEKDARNYEKEIPKDWMVDWDFSRSGRGRLKIYSSRKSLGKGESLAIVITKVISKTDPEGSACVSLESARDVKQDFDIKKTADKPDIVYFSSAPEEDVLNLPGDSVILKWRTNKLENRKLTQDGHSTPLTADFGKGREEGSHAILAGPITTTFLLEGYDNNRLIGQKLSVKVLEAGWYSIKNTLLEGDPGYPSPVNDAEVQALQNMRKQCSLEPTLLLNANDQWVYAVFRHIFENQERAFLFQTKNSFGSWQLVETSVRGQSAGLRIPDGFSTSPGVYLDKKLWLIGGSQIDPDLVSNHVWCCDPQEGKVWESWGTAAWSPRMGHAVLEFQNKIWVMGGRDAAGNALNDVWTLDVTTGQWTQLDKMEGQKASWTPRCLFTPAVFEDAIWLYGGAQEPFSSKLYDDVHRYANGTWTKLEITGIIADNAARKPIASCLQVFNNKLYLFGKFRTVNLKDQSEIVEPLAFSLSTPSTKTWSTFPNDGLKNWGGDTTFSYQLVGFRNKMLIAKALSYEATNPVLKVYVPG